MIVLVLTCIGMFFTRTLLVSQAISSLENNPGQFVSFSRVASSNEVFMYMVALVVFTSSIKGIKLPRFNCRVTILAQTLRGSAGPLAAFSVVFIVFLLAYSLFPFAVFGKDLPDFYNFVSTCETVMGVLLGSFDFLALTEVAPVLGPLFFFSFMVFGTFILMNMFLTIVLDVFSEVKESIDEQETEYEIIDFMIRRFRKLTGMQKKFGFINGVDNVTWPPYRDSKLLESLYGGQFTLSTPLIKPNFLILLPHRRSTTVSLETTPFIHRNAAE